MLSRTVAPIFASSRAIRTSARALSTLVPELTRPKTICIVGASGSEGKPGGALLRNVLARNSAEHVYAVNTHEIFKKPGLKGCYPTVGDVPGKVDLAILAVSARHCPSIVETLVHEKNTKAVIVVSGGFSEDGESGAALENAMVATLDQAGGTLIGPNCIGIANRQHCSIFTLPLPNAPNPAMACDMISASGATAVFIMEAGSKAGVPFNSIFSLGNAAQTGVEDVLEHLDETYEHGVSPRVKMLYLESIDDPARFLKHSRSIIAKGGAIAAIKSGSSSAGSRAALSHTGALSTADVAVEALLHKAGVIRCKSRLELVTVGSILLHKPLLGSRLAVVTHAGGPGVIMTDALSNGGLDVPPFSPSLATSLNEALLPGSSGANPVDILATGTEEHLKSAVNLAASSGEVDGVCAIFGSPGLSSVSGAYDAILSLRETCHLPVYAVMPSVINAGGDMDRFVEMGGTLFTDEYVLARSLCKVASQNRQTLESQSYVLDKNPCSDDTLPKRVGKALNGIQTEGESTPCKVRTGFLPPNAAAAMLDAAEIPRVREVAVSTPEDLLRALEEGRVGLPCALKVVGPVHKTDVGGVILNLTSADEAVMALSRLMDIPDASGVIAQDMLRGDGAVELFIGAQRHDKVGHVITYGLGGIHLEVFKDVNSSLVPVSPSEALAGLNDLHCTKLLRGQRGHTPTDPAIFAEAIAKVSRLVCAAPGIKEMDINPLIACEGKLCAVDWRILLDNP